MSPLVPLYFLLRAGMGAGGPSSFGFGLWEESSLVALGT